MKAAHAPSGLPVGFPRPAVLLLALALMGHGQGASGQDNAGESPFAGADMKPDRPARCGDVRRLTRDVDAGGKRVDLSVVGPLALVHFDGTLAYLGLCGTPPDPKVLCVTYGTNGMKVGDVVVASGGYGRPDEDHIVLDPCLASPPPEPSPAEPAAPRP